MTTDRTMRVTYPSPTELRIERAFEGLDTEQLDTGRPDTEQLEAS